MSPFVLSSNDVSAGNAAVARVAAPDRQWQPARPLRNVTRHGSRLNRESRLVQAGNGAFEVVGGAVVAVGSADTGLVGAVAMRGLSCQLQGSGRDGWLRLVDA